MAESKTGKTAELSCGPARVAKWFREMKAELKRLCDPKQVLNNTWVVVVTVLTGLVISFWPAATQGISLLVGLKK